MTAKSKQRIILRSVAARPPPPHSRDHQRGAEHLQGKHLLKLGNLVGVHGYGGGALLHAVRKQHAVRLSVKVVAGERVKFDLPYEGVPEPEVVWTKIAVDGSVEKTISSNKSESVSVTTTEERTKLAFNNIAKRQEGRYELTVSNSNGKETASVLIVVLDRPSPPESLTASTSSNAADSDDAPSSCSLFWKKSNNDGGAPIDYYQIERLEDGKADWLACGRTKENSFEARGLLPGRGYRFRVSAVNKFGYSDLAETKEPMIIGCGGEKEGQQQSEATGRGT